MPTYAGTASGQTECGLARPPGLNPPSRLPIAAPPLAEVGYPVPLVPPTVGSVGGDRVKTTWDAPDKFGQSSLHTMKVFLTLFAVLAVLAAVATVFMAWILCLAGSANSREQQLHLIQRWAGGRGVDASVGIAGSIGFSRLLHPGWATTIAALPAAVMAGCFVPKVS